MIEDIYRKCTRAELDIAIAWAASEGWNPGLDDGDIFWETDPDGFVCIERNNEVIGTGSIVSYGDFGFMGFFIVRPDLRGQGIGGKFWHWRKQQLFERLKSGTSIGMDGVFDMQAFYAKGGFEFSHRNIRMEGLAQASPVADTLTELSQLPFEQISEFDKRCFGTRRENFLRRWIAPQHGLALGARENDQLTGYGVIRQCQTGFKIGPLFAETPETAESLFLALSNHAQGKAIFLDVPENHPAALDLAKRHNMREVFGCARMYAGPTPQIEGQSVYGVTTFELG